MIRYALALLALTGNTAYAADEYDPQKHPAVIVRKISSYTAPIRMLDLAAEEPGRITAVLLQPGDHVPAGDQAVVHLNAELADLAVATAEANLAARRRDGEWHAQDRAHAERDVERAEKIFAEGRMAEQNRDAALRERDRARGAAATDMGVIAAAEAELAAAKSRRTHRDLRAPSNWVVIERLREPGAMVAAGEPILRLADVSELVVQVRLDEMEVAALRSQDEANTLSLRFAGRSEAVPARIRRVDVTYDPISRKRLIELTLPGNAAPEASGGLSVNFDVTVADPSGGVLIPLSLVEWRLERPVVRATDGSEFAVVPLRRTDDALIVPANGLPAGIKLATKPTAVP